MILRANKGVGLITRLRRYLSRNYLLTFYKTFIRPHLDYRDVVYEYPGSASFMQKLESVHYNASSAITGSFRGTSRDKLYSELGLESLADRWFYRRLVAFYETVNKKAPQYLIDYLPTQDLASINLRKIPAIYPLDARTERYRNYFFSYCISQWNNLNSRIKNLPSIATFKRVILILYALTLHHISRQIGSWVSYPLLGWGLTLVIYVKINLDTVFCGAVV